jgi:arsenate reductase-like glutaredoxin family protein
VQFTRQYVVDILRRTGYTQVADEAMRVLPDPVDREDVDRWASQYGITIDELINRMGGSP